MEEHEARKVRADRPECVEDRVIWIHFSRHLLRSIDPAHHLKKSSNGPSERFRLWVTARRNGRVLYLVGGVDMTQVNRITDGIKNKLGRKRAV